MSDDPSTADAASPRSLLARPRRTWRTFFPIVSWFPQYPRTSWSSDLVAGVALAALMIPESMGYAGVAGVPAEMGLYAALGGVIAYALTGGTSILVVGPASAVSALTASIVAEFRGDVPRAELVMGLTIATGVLLILAGVLRLGWVVNFISRPVLHAFVAGLSIAIIIGQLDGLFGVEVEGHSALAKFVDTVRHVGDWHGLTAIVGVVAVVVLIGLERLVPRVPAAVVVVAAGIVLAVVADLADRGVAVVGEIPRGLPNLTFPDLGATRWFELFGGATALLLLGFSEGYAAASAVAAGTGEEVDADQELVGSGAANLAAGFLGGIPVGGGLSKSAASQAAGARSQVTNLVSALLILATLIFLGPLFEHLPEPILAAVVIASVSRSANPRRVLQIRSINRLDFLAGALTFVLVIVWETLPALIVGVVLSLAALVHRASFPDVVELQDDSDGTFRRVDLGGAVLGSQNVSVIRFEAPLVYANAERLQRACRAVLARRPSTSRLVLDCEMLSDLDSTGADILRDLDDDLRKRGVSLHLARVHLRAREQIDRSDLADRFATRMHDRIADAVSAERD